MLNFTDVTIRRGPRVLFAGATFGLFRGEKVGIVGENGSGKSTLLSLVRGELHTDGGTFSMPSNLAMAWVSQDVEATDQAALEFVLDGDAELRSIEAELAAAEAADDGIKLAGLYGRYGEVGGYDARSRAAQLMHGLGFDTADETRPIRAFSGGWRVRINVARALMCRSDLLLLDEPTNHLDIDAILWLENWLREYRGTLLLIAHDREFLDRICDRIVSIERETVKAYRGNYTAYEAQRAAELAEQSALFVRQQREIKHMESFVERFRAKASKARQAQSRLKALERMQRIAPAHVDSPAFEFNFAEPLKLPKPLLALDGQGAGYGDKLLLRDVSLTLSPGDRVALLGRNGAGKSTCMKLLAGELPGIGGTRTEARDLAIGYFAQHHLELLKPAESSLQNLLRIGGERAKRMTELELRDFLARFGFRGDRVFEPVEPFSGGEKARLVLALVTFQRPNLLLLDEPTNHLDLEMRQALSVALQEYSGAVVLVSHDRHLLNTVADQFYVVHGGRAELFDGDLEDYARWLADGSGNAEAQQEHDQAAIAVPVATVDSTPAAGAAAGAPAAQASAPPAAKPASGDRKQQRRDEAAARAKIAPLRAEVAVLEKRLAELSTRRAEVEQQLGDAGLYEEGARAQLDRLLGQQSRIAADIEAAEASWMKAVEQLEHAERH